MFRQNLLAGRRILVTGGGTGLGKSMAARFLQLGAEIHICGRRKIVCDETATELGLTASQVEQSLFAARNRLAEQLVFGDRLNCVTVQRLAELADFYGVPVAELLPDATPSGASEPPPRLVIDLEQLADVPPEKARPLARYAATIQSQRGDYNGRVLSIRQDDLRSLAVIYDESPSLLTEELISWGVLNAEARRAIEAL